MKKTAKQEQPAVPLKLDLGCGKNKREGFIGVDTRPFDCVDQVVDLTARDVKAYNSDGVPTGWAGPAIPFKPWPWADGSVEEVHCSHFVEHLTAPERIHFVNELYRVLIPNGKAQIIVPHWASCRAYGDLTHQWPPVSEFWFYYLSKEWRDQNAPHNDGYKCNFEATWGYSMRPEITVRNVEYQMFALNNYKEAAQDIIATLTKR